MFLFAPFRWAFKLIYFAVLASAVYVVVSGFQVVLASHLPTQPRAVGPARAIVVLGASTAQTAPGRDLTARLRQALLLFDAQLAPSIVVVGQTADTTTPAETSVARAWLVANGVPAAAVQAVTGNDAAGGLAQVSASLGGGKVIIVTDAIDALWTKGAASQAGLTPELSPAVGTEEVVYDQPGALWRQATGVAVGRLVGYRRATWAAH